MKKLILIISISLLFAFAYDKNDNETLDINYRAYTILLSQSNDNDPFVGKIYKNSLGKNINWIRGGEGFYYGEIENGFPENTFCIAQRSPIDNYGREIKIYRNLQGQIELWQQIPSTGGLVDGFAYLQIEIRVYP